MVTFSATDPTFLENPYPFYAMGRAMSPLYLEDSATWHCFGYNDCVGILRDHTTWSSFTIPPEHAAEMEDGPSMLGDDPPRHTRLRGLVSQAFTPRMVEQLEPRIYEIANSLVDEICATNECDLVGALSYPLPVIVIAEILGIPPEDRENFKRWSDIVIATLGSGLAPAGEDVPQFEGEMEQATIEEIRVYFERIIADRREHPKNDLISGLVAAEVEGSKLNTGELYQMLILLLVAGNETTTNLIGNAVQEFMTHPDQLAKLMADRALLPTAIEEVLRFSSPVQATVRRATRDVELGGKSIAAGQYILPWLAAANRDPAIFPDPDTFDVTRTPNRHLAFGMGVHFCLGAPLARLEAKVALDVFLRRVRDFRRTDDRALPRVPTFIMRGVRELPIAYEVVG